MKKIYKIGNYKNQNLLVLNSMRDLYKEKGTGQFLTTELHVFTRKYTNISTGDLSLVLNIINKKTYINKTGYKFDITSEVTELFNQVSDSQSITTELDCFDRELFSSALANKGREMFLVDESHFDYKNYVTKDYLI